MFASKAKLKHEQYIWARHDAKIDLNEFLFSISTRCKLPFIEILIFTLFVLAFCPGQISEGCFGQDSSTSIPL